MPARVIRFAAAQYPIDEITSFAAFEEKLSRWVQEAVAHDAQFLVFPEYGGMELSRIAGRQISLDLHGSIEALQYHIGHYEAAYAELAKRYGVFILAGSAPIRLTDGRFVNRAQLFSPNGHSGFQQKHIMTRFEGEEWGISPSSGLCVFDIGSAKIGIAICYDSEFPLIARALAESGAEILIVPSSNRPQWAKRRGRSPSMSMSAPPGFSRRLITDSPEMASSRWAPSIKHSGFTRLSISACSPRSEKTATC